MSQEEKELIILKLGGSVITKKSEEKAEIDEENLERLAKEISEAKKEKDFKLIIVHGAGPFGHVPAKKYKLHEGLKNEEQVKGFARTHQLMEKLNFLVVSKLQNEGLNAIAYQPSSLGILKERRLIYFPTNVLEEFLKLNLIPVLYGDVLVDKNKGIGILSGDHLVPYLAEKLNSDKIILCADVDGIFTEDPKKNKNAQLIPLLSRNNLNKIKELSGSKNTDVTGGMSRKVQELLELVEKNKEVKIEIINGFKSGLLKRTLLGEMGLGTTIRK
jgi:isopentenyl phosphate kinase